MSIQNAGIKHPNWKKTWQKNSENEDNIGKEIRFYNDNFPVANPVESKQHSQGIQIPWNWDQYTNNAPLLFYCFPLKNVPWSLKNNTRIMYRKFQPGHQPPFTVAADRFIFWWLKTFLREQLILWAILLL